MQTHSKPYVSLYRYTLTPGEKYTVQAEYGADYLGGSVCIWGYNPLAPNKYYSNPSGTAPIALCIHRSFPGGNIKGYVWGKRESFRISPKSKHNYAWLAYYSPKANVPLKIRMISPALPDEKIKKEGSYTKIPGKPIYNRWSLVRQDPLYRRYVKGEKPFSETTTASSTVAETIAAGIAGKWELKDVKEEPYGRMNLTQSGNQDQGRVLIDAVGFHFIGVRNTFCTPRPGKAKFPRILRGFSFPGLRSFLSGGRVFLLHRGPGPGHF
jgi:hypothetical protein